MKFLIFNITVAAALIYLFTVDRAEVQNTAGRIHDAAAEVKQAANRVVEKGRNWVDPRQAGPQEAMADRPRARSTEPRAENPPLNAAVPARPLSPLPPRRDPLWPSPAPSAAEDIAAERPSSPADAGEPKTAAKSGTAGVETANAATLKRREEILRGIDPAVVKPGAKPEQEAAKPAVSPDERRKQLYSLSEEMELFYARSLSE